MIYLKRAIDSLIISYTERIFKISVENYYSIFQKLCAIILLVTKERVIKIKILICDDSITIRKKLRGAIQLDEPIEFIETKNGQEAIDAYKEEQPQIVFMDIIMPEVDGIQALSTIRAFDNKAIVIMLSSVGTKQNLKTALENGASDFIQKPWDINNLNRILSKYVRS